jgi:hypothetical protein
MYTSKIYFVMWFKDRLDWLPHSFIFTQIISQIFYHIFVSGLDLVVLTSLSRPPKEVCCGLGQGDTGRGSAYVTCILHDGCSSGTVGHRTS